MALTGKEALAVITIGGVVGSAGGGAIASHEQGSSRAAAITADLCGDTYNSHTENGREVSQGTLDCMSSGWVPEGRSLDVSDMSAGDPEALLRGYVMVHDARANNFDLSKVLWGGVLGLAGGFMLALVVDGVATKEMRKEREQAEQEATDTADKNMILAAGKLSGRTKSDGGEASSDLDK